MAFIARVASSAAAIFSLAGLISIGAPARAADITQPVTPMVQVVQSLTTSQVPSSSASADANTMGPAVADKTDASDEEFASLDDAVAAQDSVAVDEATRCLAGAIYFESKGEPLSGQLAVAQVIINRAKSGRFPPDVCGVVTQRGQFSFVRGGRIPSIDEARAAYRTAVSVARVALADAWDGVAEKAMYFNTPGRLPGARLQRIAMIGNHVFYR